MRGVRAALGVCAVVAVLPAAAHGQTQVEARGDPFTGGLEFRPADVAVPVGGVVRWTNVDELVPHTATEDHQLWDLAGTYGQTPANPPGFGPGESRERSFEAGTHRYFCKVHPAMRGSVAVAVRLERAASVVESKPTGRRRARRRIRVTWAPEVPAAGLGFDVEIRRGEGPWRKWRDGKRAASGTFRTQERPAPWSVRARLRRLDDARQATDWSPLASIAG
jgi:plastocyanin